MNSRYLIACLCLAALSPAVKADKYYLGKEAEAEKMAAGEARIVQGVLLEEKNDRYILRVEGGQIELMKSQVYKVESDGLTVAKIEQAENDSRELLAEIDGQRAVRHALLAEAELQRVRAVRAAEAAATVEASLPLEPVPAGPAMRYDPVIDVVRESVPGAYNADYYVRKELGGIIRRRLNDAARQLR